MAEKPNKKRLITDISRVIFVIGLFILAAYIINRPASRAYFDVHYTRTRIQEAGWRGNAMFFLIASALTGLGVPRLWISAAAGGVYGAAFGIIIAQVASMTGATINFFFARSILRGPLKRRLPQRMKRWVKRFSDNGFRWLLYMRLFPLSNATLTNVVGGISQMKFSEFISATFIGYLPLTIAFALFGSSAVKHNHIQLLLAGAIFMIVLVGRRLYEKWRPITEEADTEAIEVGAEEPKMANAR